MVMFSKGMFVILQDKVFSLNFLRNELRPRLGKYVWKGRLNMKRIRIYFGFSVTTFPFRRVGTVKCKMAINSLL